MGVAEQHVGAARLDPVVAEAAVEDVGAHRAGVVGFHGPMVAQQLARGAPAQAAGAAISSTG